MPRTSSKRATARPLSFESTKTWIGSPRRVASCTAEFGRCREPGDPSKASTIGPGELCAPSGHHERRTCAVLRITPLTVEPISARAVGPACCPSRPTTVEVRLLTALDDQVVGDALGDVAGLARRPRRARSAERRQTAASARLLRYAAIAHPRRAATRRARPPGRPRASRSSTTERPCRAARLSRAASATPKRSAAAAASDPSVATRSSRSSRSPHRVASGEPPSRQARVPQTCTPQAHRALHPVFSFRAEYGYQSGSRFPPNRSITIDWSVDSSSRRPCSHRSPGRSRCP